MLARKYTKRIELWQTVEIADGFGGNTVLEQKLGEQWAMLQNQSNLRSFTQRATDLGILDIGESILFTFRWRYDTRILPGVTYIKYKGYKYIIQSFSYIDLREVDIQVFARRERLTVDNTEYPVSVNVGFPYRFTFELS